MATNALHNCEGASLISRRDFLKATAILSFAALPEFAIGREPSDARLLTILLRGGLDGLHAMPPVGERRLESLRQSINPDNILKLDGFFGLHPSFPTVHKMYQVGEALLVHGTSIPYTGRSHFEGQDLMESGADAPYASASGWMGRALDLDGYHSLALSLPAPLILRSAQRPGSYYPSWLDAVPQPLFDKIQPLWASDPVLSEIGQQMADEREHGEMQPGGNVSQRRALIALAEEAGLRLKSGTGPRMAVLDHVGFDTHANEPSENGRLMREVDDALAAFRAAIGDEVWKKTLVVTVTEFGRTVAENGSRGTDHGWGTCIFVLGGRLKQGGIVADWPGLSDKALFEGRDLASTIDARSLYGALMSNVIEADPELIRRQVIDHDPIDLFSRYL